MLIFSEIQFYGNESINYTPIYASSNAFKDIIIYDTATVVKHRSFIVMFQPRLILMELHCINMILIEENMFQKLLFL